MSSAEPFEVRVFGASDLTTQIDVFPGASEVTFTDVKGDVGSGSCVLSLYDPKATPTNVAEGNLIKLCLGGVPVFAYFIDAPVKTVGEAAESTRQLAGQGALSYTHLAIVYPAGWTTAGLYPVTREFAGVTPGSLLNTLLTEAKARGTVPALTWDFTATEDSHGVAWVTTLGSATAPFSVKVLSNVLDVIKKLYGLGVGIYMTPDLVLHAYNPGGFGSDLSASVIWRMGHHLMGPVTDTSNHNAMTNVVLAGGSGGYFAESSDATTGDPSIGRREGGLDFTSSNDPTTLLAAGAQQISLSEIDQQSIRVSLNHGATADGLYEPYVDYRVADTIALDVPGEYDRSPFAIAGLTVTQTDNANYTIDADLGSVILDPNLRLLQLLAAMSGSTSQVTGGISGNLLLTNPLAKPPFLVLTPAQLTASVNNWDPTGGTHNWTDVGLIIVDANAARSITGIDATGVPEFFLVSLYNKSGFTVTLAHESASSLAANRIQAAAGATLLRSVGQVELRYFRGDGVNYRWHVEGA